LLFNFRKSDLPSPGAMTGNVVIENQSSDYEIPDHGYQRPVSADYEKLQLEQIERT